MKLMGANITKDIIKRGKNIETEKEISADVINLLDFSLHMLINVVRFDSIEILAPKLKGIPYIDLSMLQLLTWNPDITLKEIRNTFRIPSSTLTSIINRLEKKGYITRTISPHDRRSFILKMTAKGKEINKEHEKVDKIVSRTILEALPSQTEREQFIELINLIVTNIKKL